MTQPIDIKTAVLLERAAAACREHELMFVSHPYMYPDTPGATACAWGTPNSEAPPQKGRGETLSDALTALLDDLGVKVEWPSADQIDYANTVNAVKAGYLAFLRDLAQREPLTVLALLGMVEA